MNSEFHKAAKKFFEDWKRQARQNLLRGWTREQVQAMLIRETNQTVASKIMASI